MKKIKPFYLVLIANVLLMPLYFVDGLWGLFIIQLVLNGLLFFACLFVEKYRILSLAFLLSALLVLIVGFSSCLVLMNFSTL